MEDEKTVESKFNCDEGGKHTFDQFDMEHDGPEYGHCTKCRCWIDVDTGDNETEEIEELFGEWGSARSAVQKWLI